MSHRSRKSEENAFELKSKVQELESEVSKLKQRLDDLRKAKNNTILKREREVVQVGGPNLGRPVGVETSKYKGLEDKFKESESQKAELENKLKALEKDLNQTKSENSELKQKYDNVTTEVERIKADYESRIANFQSESRESRARAEDLFNELERIREKLEMKSMQEETSKVSNNERELYITNLINENTHLRETTDKLNDALSVKEAHWLNSEEQFKLKIQQRWDEKYAKWMSDMEKKLEELRMTNLVLKECLAKKDSRSKPDEAPSSSKPSS